MGSSPISSKINYCFYFVKSYKVKIIHFGILKVYSEKLNYNQIYTVNLYSDKSNSFVNSVIESYVAVIKLFNNGLTAAR